MSRAPHSLILEVEQESPISTPPRLSQKTYTGNMGGEAVTWVQLMRH